jgi:hypothetical protein
MTSNKNLIWQLPLVAAALYALGQLLDFLPKLSENWLESVYYLFCILVLTIVVFKTHQTDSKWSNVLLLFIALGGFASIRLVGQRLFQERAKPIKTDVITNLDLSKEHVEFDFNNEFGRPGRLYAFLQPCDPMETNYAGKIFIGTVNATGITHSFASFKDIYWPYLRDEHNDPCFGVKLILVPDNGTEILLGVYKNMTQKVKLRVGKPKQTNKGNVEM